MAHIEVIKIGEKEVEMRASALTSVIYKNLFGIDVLQEINELGSYDKSDSIGMVNKAEDVYRRLGFVMAWQAKNVENVSTKMKSLTEDDFYEWLDEFEANDFLQMTYITSVQNVWKSNAKATAIGKNSVSPQ